MAAAAWGQRRKQAPGAECTPSAQPGMSLTTNLCCAGNSPSVACLNEQVQASFFGVGAPEAVLVGLVALVIFGPQGLAEVRFGCTDLMLKGSLHQELCTGANTLDGHEEM